MRKITRTLTLAVLVGSVGFAYATDGSVGVVKERQDLMIANAGAAKALGTMLQSGTIDAAAAQAALETLVANAKAIPTVFETNDLTPPTKASPAIWEQYDAFTALAMTLQTSAEAGLAAPGDAAVLGAAMQGIGGSCKACHTQFQTP